MGWVFIYLFILFYLFPFRFLWILPHQMQAKIRIVNKLEMILCFSLLCLGVSSTPLDTALRLMVAG